MRCSSAVVLLAEIHDDDLCYADLPYNWELFLLLHGQPAQKP